MRLSVDEKREITESKDEIKKIHMEKITMDHRSEMKLSGMRVSTQEEAQRMMMIERTQVMDTLYLKYKLKLSDLLRAVELHKLNDDDDVKKLKAANMQ